MCVRERERGSEVESPIISMVVCFGAELKDHSVAKIKPVEVSCGSALLLLSRFISAVCAEGWAPFNVYFYIQRKVKGSSDMELQWREALCSFQLKSGSLWSPCGLQTVNHRRMGTHLWLQLLKKKTWSTCLKAKEAIGEFTVVKPALQGKRQPLHPNNANAMNVSFSTNKHLSTTGSTSHEGVTPGTKAPLCHHKYHWLRLLFGKPHSRAHRQLSLSFTVISLLLCDLWPWI